MAGPRIAVGIARPAPPASRATVMGDAHRSSSGAPTLPPLPDMSARRNAAMLLGLAAGGALAFALSRASRARPCETTSRADILLGGGLPVCFGRPASQLAQYGTRVTRAAAGEAWVFPAGELRYTYQVGAAPRWRGADAAPVYAACVEIAPGHLWTPDSLAAFRRGLLGGQWVRTDSSAGDIRVTTWRREDGLRYSTSPAGIFCARPPRDGA